MKSIAITVMLLLLGRRATAFSAQPPHPTFSSLGKRLENIRDLALLDTPTHTSNVLVDVCSDHALLPIAVHASPQNPFSRSIAIDISLNACVSASSTLETLPHPPPPISIIQGDGLLPLLPPSHNNDSHTDDSHTVVIAGVGVNTILDILSPLQTKTATKFPKLILSPTKTRSRNLLKLLSSPTLLKYYQLQTVKINDERSRYYFALSFEHKKTATKQSPPKPYVVYLLKSISNTHTYIGTTNDLPRRLRQHNGELAGSAKSTHSGRPWIISHTVSGFKTSRSSATSFEHSWKKQQGYENRISNLSHLTDDHSPPLPLTIRDHLNIKSNFSDQIEEKITPYIHPEDAESQREFANYLEFDRRWESLDSKVIESQK